MQLKGLDLRPLSSMLLLLVRFHACLEGATLGSNGTVAYDPSVMRVCPTKTALNGK